MAKKKAARRSKVEASSRGMAPAQITKGPPPQAVRELEAEVEADGGVVIGSYRDPLGGKWQLIVAVPIDKVEPTPYQRDLSDAHTKRLTQRIDDLNRYLDPIIAVRKDGTYWTPNGHHRLAAMRALGARSITAVLVPEPEMAFRILSLNTEKAHNLKEKSLEVIRMERELASLSDAPEREHEVIFEEPAFLTLGAAYEQRGRFSGSVYHPILKRVDDFLDVPLAEAVETREARAASLLEIDEAVADAVAALKERGFESPYLKNFVVARVNPVRFVVRFVRGEAPEFDATIEKMLDAARSFEVGKVKADQLAKTGGPAGE